MDQSLPQLLHRRAVLKLAAAGGLGYATGGARAFAATAGIGAQSGVASPPPHPPAAKEDSATAHMQGIAFNVRQYGAKGDGTTIDTKAIQSAIDAAAGAGGGTVFFPAGQYASYSLQLKSYVALYLDQGAILVAAEVPLEGTTSGGYDAAEQQGAFEPYQDYGHNHWHNSLLWGEGIHDISILGRGLIWGKGLSRGHDHDTNLPDTTKPGVANKAIALKNCFNVTLKDFSILQGGWFGILATGVDNFTIENLIIDTNRDGMDIDCCRNVRVSNCTVNSPWDDGICPKSSFALGYARPTQNLTITNCFVTGMYELGTVLDGTWKLMLETVDGAHCEDITFTGITMRNSLTSPFFLRLGQRMRGPAGVPVGTLKRVILSNITSYNSVALPSSITGVPGHPIEDIKISDVFLHQVGGGTPQDALRVPPENENAYPEPTMFGALPATGLFCRHMRNLEVTNVEVQTAQPDERAAFWLNDVDGADFFRVKTPRNSKRIFVLGNVQEFRSFGSRSHADVLLDEVESQTI
jgi:polygalacturonase